MHPSLFSMWSMGVKVLVFRIRHPIILYIFDILTIFPIQ